MNGLRVTSDAESIIRELGDKYLWWEAVTPEGHAPLRIIAQIMRFATYDDIRRLESVVGTGVLARAMIDSAPGWFDDRRWGFWRGRLSFAGEHGIPEQRPKRTFAHATVL